MGCRRRPPADLSGLAAAVRLGWRWVPGTSFTFHSVVTRTSGAVAVARGEAWTYTALDLDPTGVVTLHGALVGFGATVTERGEEIEDPSLKAAREKARAEAPTEVDMRLRLTGRLVDCSDESFASGLPHRLLGMRLPADPVAPGAVWDDPSFALAFARLLPVELPVRVASRTTFRAFEEGERGWQAHLEHQGTVFTTDGGPVLRVNGSTLWDADPGAIASRRIEVRLEPDEPMFGARLGVLRAEINRERRAEGVATPLAMAP